MVDITTIGIALVLAGFLIVFLTAFSARSRHGDGEERRTEVRGGGVIMIGPIPIIFGSDARWTVIAIILAIILIAVSFVFMQMVRVR